MISNDFKANSKRYGDLLRKRFDGGRIGKEKLVRLAVKHKQWNNTAVERGIYNG